MTEELIQQLQRYNTQLKKISTLNEVDNLTENVINDNYLLLTKPNENNYIVKLKTLFNNISDIVDENIADKINQLNQKLDEIYTKNEINSSINDTNNKFQNINGLIQELQTELSNYQSQLDSYGEQLETNYYNKNDIDESLSTLKYSLIDNINSKREEIFDLIEEVQTELTAHKSQIVSSYYDKDKINELLGLLKDSLLDDVNENISSNVDDLQTDINDIKNEINSSINTQHQEISSLIQELQTELSNYQSQLNSYEEQLETNYYDKNNIDESLNTLKYSLIENINSKREEIFDLIEEVQTELTAYKSQIVSSYYDKDKINELLRSLKDSLLDDIDNKISSSSNRLQNDINDINDKLLVHNNIINDINGELLTNSNDIKTIKNELLSNISPEFNNSRIDRLENELQYIKTNINIDNINKVIWVGYGLSNNNISNYIIDENESISFDINKGNIIVQYNDGTEDETIYFDNDNIECIISTGVLNNNTITLSYNNITEGSQNIIVKYKDHIAINNDDTTAEIKFNVIKSKYYNHFWVVDSLNLNKVFNNSNFTDINYAYKINSSLECPMQHNYNYNAEQILREKFYNNEEFDYINNELYLILPSEYINIENQSFLRIDGNILKSNIFEINIEGLSSIFNIHEKSFNSNNYKDIEYSVIKISNTINKGISLNI